MTLETAGGKGLLPYDPDEPWSGFRIPSLGSMATPLSHPTLKRPLSPARKKQDTHETTRQKACVQKPLEQEARWKNTAKTQLAEGSLQGSGTNTGAQAYSVTN